MQLKLPAAVLACWLISVGTSYAEAPSNEALDDIFAFKGLVYKQDDGGGNPSINEDASVYEGIIFVRKRVSEHNAASIELLGETISAASYDDAIDRAQAVSGASGYNPGRWDIKLGWVHARKNWNIYGTANYGQEFAYRTRGYSIGGSASLAEGATQLSAGLQIYDDIVRVIRFDGSSLPKTGRDTYTIDLGITQALTPLSAVNFGWSHTEQTGYLETSFNSVLINGTRDFESVPDDRRRDALSVRYKHALGEHSAQIGYSYYHDDWGIRASTLEGRYYHWLKPGLLLEPSYRYYTQGEADFFAQSFTSAAEFQTSDPDLGDFDGHAFGLTTTVFAVKLPYLPKADYDIGINYYDRSDNLDFYWLTIGWRFPF